MARKDLAEYLQNPQNMCTEKMVICLGIFVLSPWHAKDGHHPFTTVKSQLHLVGKKRVIF